MAFYKNKLNSRILEVGFKMLVTQSTTWSTHSTVHASSTVIQSDSDTSVLSIPGEKLEGVEEKVEKVTSISAL